jgi:probable selenium-dependent hydroxylase accessory protein YqeC
MEEGLFTILQNSGLELTGKAHTSPLIISVVGAGGKTSLLNDTAVWWDRNISEKCCIFTTTTQMHHPEMKNYQSLSPFSSSFRLSELAAAIRKNRLAAGKTPFIFDRMHESGKKVYGISPDQIEKLSDLLHPISIVCEADGSHKLPIKAPDEHEPVHPRSADAVVGCLGLSSLGKPINSGWVHRVSCLTKILHEMNCSSTCIDLEVLESLIRHPKGLFKNSPAGAKKIVLLNQGDLLMYKDVQLLSEHLFPSSSGVDTLIICSIKPNFTIIHSKYSHKGEYTV